ncbi:MAG: hypothetical protein ACJAU0_000314 [Flavobacteriales bacterium]|jgi:hypothetical protein
MKYFILALLLSLVSTLCAQSSNAVDPFPSMSYKVSMKIKDSNAILQYKKTDLMVYCSWKDGQIDSIQSVQSNKLTLDRFTHKEKEEVLELMEVLNYSGFELYEQITEMFNEDAKIKSEFQKMHLEYRAFLPNQFGEFSEGCALVKSKGKYGFIDRSGMVVFDFIFDNASNFKNDQAHVKVNGVWYLLEKDGMVKLLN